ncbi:hypothetical protein V1511DRAFT_500492 [Dipodascopsis uninucleata]
MTLRIAIIGAGTAGISCARGLLQCDTDIVIYEARDRLGGRIAESRKLEKAVDLGPNWMHGSTKENTALPFFLQPGVVLQDIGYESIIFSPEGECYTPKESEKIESIMWHYVEKAIEYSKENVNSIEPDQSLYDYICYETDKCFNNDPNQRDIIKMAVESFGFYIGEHINKQSLKFAMLEDPVPGDNLFVASGFVSLFDKIAESIVRSPKIEIKKNCAVSEVLDMKGKVGVKSVSGFIDAFDAVVVAVPLGVLKRKELFTFRPALPQRITSSIESLGYGRLEKVYIQFPRDFWKADYFEFLSPAYDSKNNLHRHPMTAISLAHLPKEYKQPVLLWYLYGEMSMKIQELQNDEEIIEFFHPYFTKIPGFKAELDIPNAVIRTSWTKDEFAGYGSYSNFQVGLKDGINDIKCLRRGLRDRHIWFAGEHCSDILQLATVNGAFESGLNAAQSIIDYFKL